MAQQDSVDDRGAPEERTGQAASAVPAGEPVHAGGPGSELSSAPGPCPATGAEPAMPADIGPDLPEPAPVPELVRPEAGVARGECMPAIDGALVSLASRAAATAEIFPARLPRDHESGPSEAIATVAVRPAAPSSGAAAADSVGVDGTAAALAGRVFTDGSITFHAGLTENAIHVPAFGGILFGDSASCFAEAMDPADAVIIENDGVESLFDISPPHSDPIDDLTVTGGMDATISFTATEGAGAEQPATIDDTVSPGAAVASGDGATEPGSVSATLSFAPAERPRLSYPTPSTSRSRKTSSD
ncbi:MAG: hypothetical protein ACREGL_06700 [Alphaproteobacteria bacterium]